MDYCIAVKNIVNFIDWEDHSRSINCAGGEVGEIMYRIILQAVVLNKCMFMHVL